jgi:hypothetical protein
VERRTHINERLRTEFANSGRAAGIGTPYDNYGDESGGPCYNTGSVRVRMPSDSLTPEERGALNGEVKIIQPARKKKHSKGGQP